MTRNWSHQSLPLVFQFFLEITSTMFQTLHQFQTLLTLDIFNFMHIICKTKQRIKFPSSKEKEKWQELNKALGQGLRKMMKKDSSITSVTEFIYQTSLVKFGPRQIKLPSEPKPSRRQRELAILRKEKKVLQRRWKEVDESEKDGLAELWSDVFEARQGSSPSRECQD